MKKYTIYALVLLFIIFLMAWKFGGLKLNSQKTIISFAILVLLAFVFPPLAIVLMAVLALSMLLKNGTKVTSEINSFIRSE